jgi:nucleotide-binding universal stress UspA family protein
VSVAVRPTNGALPFLGRAKKNVTLLPIDPRHGIEDHGEALLSHAADIDANLIVAGGYGHSQARQIMFGDLV